MRPRRGGGSPIERGREDARSSGFAGPGGVKDRWQGQGGRKGEDTHGCALMVFMEDVMSGKALDESKGLKRPLPRIIPSGPRRL